MKRGLKLKPTQLVRVKLDFTIILDQPSLGLPRIIGAEDAAGRFIQAGLDHLKAMAEADEPVAAGFAVKHFDVSMAQLRHKRRP